MVQLAANIWGDGPASVPTQPYKPDIRVWGTWVEQVIGLFTSSGGLIYTSRVALFADPAHGASSMAWVYGNPNTAYNGVYGKAGATGAGSWSRFGDLPFSFIIASDAGLGTPNAIQATSSVPISGSALVTTNVFEANIGSPVTIAFNGGNPLTINRLRKKGLAASLLP